MINELQEFKSYITSPTSDTPRLQPKMLTDDFGSTGNLYGLEHLLTTIARGFIFGNVDNENKVSEDGIISDDFIATVANILFSWLGFDCAKDYVGNTEAINKWNKKYPQAAGWLKHYYNKSKVELKEAFYYPKLKKGQQPNAVIYGWPSDHSMIIADVELKE